MSDFHGLPIHVFENAHLRVEVLANAGPRIVRLMLNGSSENLLIEQPTKHWETPYGVFYIRGGHRLWHAPELFPRTYHPDNEGLTIEQQGEDLVLRGAIEAGTGIQKTMVLRLAADRAVLEVRHELTNKGAWPIELAPWAITQVTPGGVALLPLAGPALSNNLLPDRQIILWPYSKLDDPRLRLSDDLITVEATVAPPSKVGVFARQGWIAYLRNEILFLKRFTPQIGRAHPDNGCNIECYFDQYNMEIETIAPLEQLEPGATVTHQETWELTHIPGAVATHEGARAVFTSLSAS
jgi:hypothetical protein